MNAEKINLNYKITENVRNVITKIMDHYIKNKRKQKRSEIINTIITLVVFYGLLIISGGTNINL